MSTTRRLLPTLHFLLLWTVILVVYPKVSMVVTATSSAVDDQSKRHFGVSTPPNVSDRNEERAPPPRIVELVEGLELPYPLDNAKVVDRWLDKTGLNSQIEHVFEGREFQEAVDQILVAHFRIHKLAQRAMFKGLQRATRAEDQAEMLFELGRTIGRYKTIDISGVPSRPKHKGTKNHKMYAQEPYADEQRRRFVLGLEPYLLQFWVDSKVSPTTVWKGLKLDVRKSGVFSNPSFRVYIDYVTHLEPDKLVRYDKALNGLRHSSTKLPGGSLDTVSDLVIAQQLVDAGAPNKANDVTSRLMHALFRDWEKRGMTHDQLFNELLPSFTFELESLLQGPMKLWIEYFSKTEDQASYKALFQTILEHAKSDSAVNDLDEIVDSLVIEKHFVKMYTGSVIRPRIPSKAAEDLAYRSKLLFQEVFADMERNGMTADKMFDLFELRELRHRDLLDNPHLLTWVSFVIDRHGDLKNFRSADTEKVRIEALVEHDCKIMLNHLYEQLTGNELVTLIEEAVGEDSRLYHIFASNLVNKWKLDNKSSRDVFSLLGLKDPLGDILVMNKFSLWFRFVIETSEDEVKASLEMRRILEKEHAKGFDEMTAGQRSTFDEVVLKAMSITERTNPTLYDCISKLWFVKLLNEGISPKRLKTDKSIKNSAIRLYTNYISTRKDSFGLKQDVSLL